MSSPGVGQIAALSDALAEACTRTRPERLLVVGCATGNGFEHVDPRVTQRVVGLDVNPGYLDIARERFDGICPGLELICADVERHEFDRGSFDLIFAGLILEYVEPGLLLERMGEWVADRGTCCVVIQLAGEHHAPVSETGFESLCALAPVMRLLTPSELERHAARAGLKITDRREIPLPGRRSFHLAYMKRAHLGADGGLARSAWRGVRGRAAGAGSGEACESKSRRER